ncbi:MAG: LamG-like jellyroll fold domain-containing protein [Victivallales bacterium]
MGIQALHADFCCRRQYLILGPPRRLGACGKKFPPFFGAFSKKERILIYNYLDNQQLIFRFGSLAAGAPSTGLQADISKWEKNTWHHVCAVWDAKTAELYVDGQKSAEAPRKNPPAAPFTRLQLGEYWSGNPGSSSLDELKIYKKNAFPRRKSVMNICVMRARRRQVRLRSSLE